MPYSKTRIVGSGFSTFQYRGKTIAWLDKIDDQGQRPKQPGIAAITPLDAQYPKEIVTGRVLEAGAMIITIRELWNEPVWYQLAGLNGKGDSITDVWVALQRDPAEVTCQLIIKPPGSNTWRGKIYHNCVISDVDDTESIEVGDLSVPKTVSISYTHKTPYTHAASPVMR